MNLATARNPTKVSRLASLGIETLTINVPDPASINACVAEVSKLTNGRLDILINNAGAGYRMPLMDISLPSRAILVQLERLVLHQSHRPFCPSSFPRPLTWVGISQ
jgi:1-acylglycerone phosphate reductase